MTFATYQNKKRKIELQLNILYLSYMRGKITRVEYDKKAAHLNKKKSEL